MVREALWRRGEAEACSPSGRACGRGPPWLCPQQASPRARAPLKAVRCCTHASLAASMHTVANWRVPLRPRLVRAQNRLDRPSHAPPVSCMAPPPSACASCTNLLVCHVPRLAVGAQGLACADPHVSSRARPRKLLRAPPLPFARLH